MKLGLAERPRDASWLQVYGVALLCGIGFTMSLFIGGLPFVGPAKGDAVKNGVLIGSSPFSLFCSALSRFAAAPAPDGRKPTKTERKTASPEPTAQGNVSRR